MAKAWGILDIAAVSDTEGHSMLAAESSVFATRF
jgi:hypothetical protein